MQRRVLLHSLALALPTGGLCLAGQARAAASLGAVAPAFSALDVDGRRVSLADFKGRWVMLEWVNPGCPYVRKHYGSQNM